MKKSKILFALSVLVLAFGCSDNIVKNKSANVSTDSESGKYEYLFTEALRQKYLGSMADAIALLEECVKIGPMKSAAYFELSQILSFQGEQKKAIEYAVKAAEREKENTWIQVYCGGILANNGMIDSSIIYLQRALTLNPEDSELKTALGKVYLEAGDIKKAESILSDQKSKGLVEESDMINIINSLIAGGYVNEAESWSKDLIKRNDNEVRYKAILAEVYRQKNMDSKADSIYSNIIGKNPGDGESQMLVMTYVLEKKDYENAIAFLSSILINDNISREKKLNFMRYVINDTAFVKEEKNSIDVCLMIFESQYPNDEEVLALRPEMSVMLGLKSEAIDRFYEILKVAKTSFYSEQQLIILLAEEARFEELFGIVKVFATNYNTSILGKIYYAISAMELKKYDIAEEELKKALILAGNNDELKYSVISTQADLAFRQKKFSESFSYLDQALKLKPFDSGVLNNYAYYLAESNTDLGRALDMISIVIKDEPANATYLDTYGWVLYKLGKNKKALKIISNALSISPRRDPELLEHMGFVLKAMNKYDEAAKYFKESFEKDNTKEYLKTEIEECHSK